MAKEPMHPDKVAKHIPWKEIKWIYEQLLFSDRLREIHRPYSHTVDGQEWELCRECTEPAIGPVLWPCKTIQILNGTWEQYDE